MEMLATLTASLAGRYVIEREVGRGGMATVFLADDLKHQRKVAIKVLQPELGAVLGVERFLSEIRVTANLQHPNLLPLFDSGDADGLLYYVMPFVEGETLRARLDREQQLPVDEAVRLARTMAGALDYAHQRGVIHRDLKPENVLLHAGQPVIADFGIALAVAQAGGQRVTQTGISLGTPQYMSPEQATGDRQVDGRADIYALGAITYEMLIGEPPHVGHSAQAIIAKLMTEDVRAISALRHSVPPAVDVAVRRALEKLPADRFATAGAFAAALGDGTISAERYRAPMARSGKRIIGALAAVALLATGVAAWSLWKAQASTGGGDARVMRFVVKVDPDGKHALGGAFVSTFGRPATNSLALSPDGSSIVYTAWDSVGDGDGSFTSHLYVRHLGDERAQEIVGTEGAAHPTFSPNGDWIAFTTATGLVRTRLEGGEVQSITPARNACCLAWGANDTIVFADSLQRLGQVAAAGGSSTPISVPLSKTMRVFQPLPLSSGALLLVHVRTSLHPDSSAIYRLDRASGTAERLLSNAADPKLLGHEYLLFMRRGTLMAVRFNESTGAVAGEAVVVVDDVMHSLNMPNTGAETGIGQYAVSPRGDLVYARGGEFIGEPTDLVQVLPNGTAKTIALGYPTIVHPSVSPAGDRIAFSASVSPRSRITALFVHNLLRNVTMKVADGGVGNWRPQWSADGRSLAFESDREDGVSQVFVVAADGSGSVRRAVASGTGLSLTTWSASGVFGGVTRGDIWTAREGEAARPFFSSPEFELYPTFSPDGKWIAYSAVKNNRSEVFVRPYPGPEPAVQVSGAGGEAPAWSSDGRLLYFLNKTSPPSMMRVAVTMTGDITVGPPATVFAKWQYRLGTPSRSYDVLRDGSFFGVTTAGGASAASFRSRNKVQEFHVVLNFLTELRERVR